MRAKRADGGVIKQLIALCLFQPLSQTFGLPAPRPGSLLAFCNHHPKAVPVYGGFEPSAPGGRCSEGRIGRNREYCKRQRSKTTIFQPAFVAANVMSSRKGNGSKKPSAVRYSPSVCSLSFTDSSPASGGAFWLSPNRKEPPEGLFSLLAYSPLFLSPAVAAARAGDEQAHAGDIARGRGRAAGIAGVIVAVRPAVAGGVAHGGGAGQVLGEHIARVIAADYLAPVAALFNEGDGCADPERSYYAVLGAGPFAQVKVGGGVKPGSPAL